MGLGGALGEHEGGFRQVELACYRYVFAASLVLTDRSHANCTAFRCLAGLPNCILTSKVFMSAICALEYYLQSFAADSTRQNDQDVILINDSAYVLC